MLVVRTEALRRTHEIFVLLSLFLSLCAALMSDNLTAQSTKVQSAYELYSWSTKSEWRFSLLLHTSRNKTRSEVSEPKVVIRDLSNLKRRLSILPKGTVVFWMFELPDKAIGNSPNDLRLGYPPSSIVKEISQHAESIGIKLEVLGPA